MSSPTLNFSSVPSTTPSTPPSLLDSVGSWVKNNGSTIGSIAGGLAGAALAPETGGLSLAIPALLSAGGGAVGNIASQAANGQDLTSSSSLESDLGQAALGGVSDLGGNIIGGLVGKVGGAAADALGKESDNLALKGIGATPNQLMQFATKHGITDATGNATPEAVIKWINDNGLAGQGLDQITSKVNELQSQFDTIAKSSGITVDPNVLQKNIQDAVNHFKPYDALTNPVGSANPADHTLATNLENYFSNVQEKLGDTPTLDALNAERKAADSATSDSQFRADPQQFGPARIVGNTLRKTAQDTADIAGASTSAGSLKETGQQLSKLYDLQSIAEKAGFKGISKSTPGLDNYLASVALGSATGPVGTAAGLAIPSILRNPAVLSTLSKGTGIAGDAVGGAAAIAGKAIGSPLGIAAQQAVTLPLANSANSSDTSGMPSLSLPPTQSAVPATPTLQGDPATQAIQAMQSGQPLTQNQYQALLEKDLTTTGGRFASQITAAYNAGQPTQVQGLGVASNAVNTLQNLYNQAGGAAGPIAGGIENALGSTGLTKQSVQAYNNQKEALGQEIVSQVYGSSGTASDRDQILNLIPNINDSAQVAQSKMATLRSLIQQRLTSMTGSTPSSVSSLDLNSVPAQ